VRCSANIYFNRQCPIKKVVPQYARIKIPYTFPAANTTQKKTQIMRLKDEIKFLYMKKQQISHELYIAHLRAAQEWGNIWFTILDSIHEAVSQKLERKYRAFHNVLRDYKHL
jgi:hypothetical protein